MISNKSIFEYLNYANKSRHTGDKDQKKRIRVKKEKKEIETTSVMEWLDSREELRRLKEKVVGQK